LVLYMLSVTMPIFGGSVAYPAVTDQADPSVRLECHVGKRLPPMRVVIAYALARTLQRCTCCQRAVRRMTL
jgi:hypothetical protein